MQFKVCHILIGKEVVNQFGPRIHLKPINVNGNVLIITLLLVMNTHIRLIIMDDSLSRQILTCFRD